MMEFIKGLASGDNGAVAQVLFIVGVFNASMTGLSVIIGSFKDKTESKIDDKIYSVLHSVLHYASVVVDFLSANKAHAPKGEAAPEAEKK